MTAARDPLHHEDEARVFAEAIVDTVRQPLLILDAALAVVAANQAFYEHFAVGPAATLGRRVYALGNGQWDIPALRRLLEELLPARRSFAGFAVEHEFEAPPGRRAMLLNARLMVRGGGRPDLILLAIEDVTERRRAEEHRELLLAELGHRVKNLFALVQSLASQTAARSRSVGEFQAVFDGRLGALVRAQGLLFEVGWRGAELGALVERTLEPYRLAAPEAVEVAGEPVTLEPRRALTLSLVLHELATNAAKYGALSVPAGRVRVGWRVEERDDGRRLRLEWRERGGPEVVPPRETGFGTELIRRAGAHEPDDGAELHFAPSGLRCEIVFPAW